MQTIQFLKGRLDDTTSWFDARDWPRRRDAIGHATRGGRCLHGDHHLADGIRRRGSVGISGTSILGFGTPSSGQGDFAFLLNTSTNTVVGLNPDGWFAQPRGVSDDSQIGDGPGPTTGGNTHAVLWHGTAASLVDLNPAGLDNSFGMGVSGNNQVGFGCATGKRPDPRAALAWHGRERRRSSSGRVFGFASPTASSMTTSSDLGQTRFRKVAALLWQGAEHTVVNLHNAAYPETFASDASADSQVGTGVFSPYASTANDTPYYGMAPRPAWST